MGWTPTLGTHALVRRLGPTEALRILTQLLAGDVSGSDLLQPHVRAVLLDIGDGHAARLMNDETGARFAYWPWAWAARALAYLGDPAAVPDLAASLSDEHWRVRMTAIQTLGRLDAHGCDRHLIEALGDAHERVATAAVVALGRVGDAGALQHLTGLLHEADETEFGRLDRAIRRIEARSGE